MSDDLVRRFTREMMGSSVAHMTDDQLDTYMAPWRALAESVPSEPGPPAWFVKRRDEARRALLAVLATRAACPPA